MSARGPRRWSENLFRGCLNVNYGTNRERDFFGAATGGRRVAMSGRDRATRPLSPQRPVTSSQPAFVCCVAEPA
jgi:hypothetical protein